MSLANRVHIRRRFLRSIRIDDDLNNPDAMDGFVCPHSSAQILLTMARHVSETGQGAFTWTGPYGSGKSSLVVVLSALLAGSQKQQRHARSIFEREIVTPIRKAMPTAKQGLQIIPVVGRRDNPVSVIGDALQTAGVVDKAPKGGWTESAVLKAIKDTLSSGGSLILFVDEMGKFLEAAAQRKEDIYIFQQLAELSARSAGKFLLIGILHQSFEEYAHRLSAEVRDEWAKVQGRFVDLPVNIAGDEQVDLISRAIISDDPPEIAKEQAESLSRLIYGDSQANSEALAEKLTACWPLHPIVACLLGPMSRRRFGQNQRSIFGFLNSAEPHGFQDFLKLATEAEQYTPDRLWNYLRANLEPAIMASPDGHRWALAAEALERCEAIGGDELHVRLLKTIAVIDLFKERSGLLPSYDLLKIAFPEVSNDDLQKALSDLERWSFTIFKKFQNAHAIYAGSDFDIDDALRQAMEELSELDLQRLEALANLQPILAKRHYHATGALRWFDVRLAPLSDLTSDLEHKPGGTSNLGQFVLALPTHDEDLEQARKLCKQAARHSNGTDVVVGLSERTWTLVPLLRELMALEQVRTESPELAGDAVARREVDSRLADLQSQVETELHQAFDDASWFRKHHSPKAYRYAELNSLASDLADRRFTQSPKIHNELLNRQKPSANAIAAQNTLLRQMVLNQGQPRLGIAGFPAEGGLFASLLEATGLYSEIDGEWRFTAPSDEDACNLAPLWKATTEFIQENSGRSVRISEIYDLWRKPPYGVKDGLMPVFAVAFILSHRESVALYRDGIFRARFDDVDVEYLAKDASTIQLRWMNLTASARRLLSDLADAIRAINNRDALVHLEPIDVARAIVAIYEDLPQWTKRTMQLSGNAIKLREVLKRARDPNQFLFDDLPAQLAGEAQPTSPEQINAVVNGVKEGLNELVSAYPNMLRRLRDLMLAELQVPNASPQSLRELRERAQTIRQLSGDFHLEAFVGRLCNFDGSDQSFEGIAGLTTNKPPRDWTDPDLDRARLDIADLSQKFLRSETFSRVKGRPARREALAVVIGRNGGAPIPLLEEFDISETDKAAINEVVERVSDVLDSADTNRRAVILAALAELSARYIEADQQENEHQAKVAS